MVASQHDPEPAGDEDRALISGALARAGLSATECEAWWERRTDQDLDGLSPAQAWERGQRREVKSLVERQLSEALAAALASNPAVVQRLVEARLP